MEKGKKGSTIIEGLRHLGDYAKRVGVAASRAIGRRCTIRPSLPHSTSCVKNLGFNAGHVACASRTWQARGLSSCLLAGLKATNCDEGASQPQARG